MTHELLYTSAPRGLKPGSTGYSIVAHTAGLSPDLADRLGGLSRYRHSRIGPDPKQNGNPVALVHTLLTIGYQPYHVLSRICDSGFDHTDRSNYLAHHVVLDSETLPPAGPAWLMRQSGVFLEVWDESQKPRLLPAGRRLPTGSAEPVKCKAWAAVSGHAGWGGVLAEATDPSQPVYILFAPGQDVLPFIAESLALLPPEERWRVTFNTYFTGLAAGTTCQWRFVPNDSQEATVALSGKASQVLRVDQPMPGVPQGELVEAAITGVRTFAAPPLPIAPRGPRPGLAAPLPREAPLELGSTVPTNRAVSAVDGNVRMLLLGIVLGLVLALVGNVFLELAAGASLMRMANVLGTAEKKLLAEQEQLRQEAQSSDRNAKQKEDALASNDAEWHGRERRWQQEKQTLIGSRAEESEKLKTALAEVKSLKEAQANEKKPREDKAEIASLKKEIGELKQANSHLNSKIKELENAPKPAVPAAVHLVGTKPLRIRNLPKDVDLTRNLKITSPVELFKTPYSGDETSLGVLDLPPGWKTVQENQTTITLTDGSSPEDFTAKLSLDKNGVVTLTGVGLKKHPALGLSVIRVEKPTQPPVHYQIARPTVAEKESSPISPQVVPGPIPMTDYAMELSFGSLKSEVEALLKSGGSLALGSLARINAEGTDYELESTSVNGLEFVGGPADTIERAVMTLNGTKLQVRVTFKKGTTSFPQLRIKGFEVFRLSKDAPGHVQELYRMR